MSRNVLIFTKRVLPRSNTFVASQSNHLRSYNPIHIGLSKDTSGIALLHDKPICVQSEHSLFPSTSRLLLDGAQRLSKRWKNELKKYNAQLVHAHFGKGGHYSAPIARELKIPLITTFHGSDITQRDKFSYRKTHRENVFNRSDKILAVSSFIETKLLEAGCPADKIVKHYIGIDNDYFSPTLEKTIEPTVLFVGRLIEQKGCQYLIQAMKTVQERIPEAKLIIAGSGNYHQKLKIMAADMNHVSFLGAQSKENVRSLMSSAWITCVPSIRLARGNEEGLGMVSLESQSLGTPVVAFNTGGVSEAVADGISGLLSAEKDTAALADNLLQLLDSTTERESMATAGIARVNELFNVRKQCVQLESIYDSLS